MNFQLPIYRFSQKTKLLAETAKAYIENHFNRKIQECERRNQQIKEVEQAMVKMGLSATEQEFIRKSIGRKEAQQLRQKRKKITVNDFEPQCVIGQGGFGEVWLCKSKLNEEIVAIKKIKKTEIVIKNHVKRVLAEREVLSQAHNLWIVELKYSFQDENYLYLVMEYLPGGDLMTLLMRKNILSEKQARFYIAETILAIESVHKLNYIHRDLKPDNLLIDQSGHIKLSDFGLCKYANIQISSKSSQDFQNLQLDINSDQNNGPFRRTRQLAFSAVGTPDYIAPEILQQKGYDQTVDF